MLTRGLVKWISSIVLILSLSSMAHAEREISINTSRDGLAEVVAKFTSAEEPSKLELERVCFSAVIREYLAQAGLNLKLKNFERSWTIIGEPTLIYKSHKAYAFSVAGRNFQSFYPQMIKFTLVDPVDQQELSSESEVSITMKSENIQTGNLQRQTTLRCMITRGTFQIENTAGAAIKP